MNQTQALKILNSGKNIFLTGEAGTGKSYLIKEFIKEKESEHKNILITASTGIAALNINGTTAHKAFSIPIPAYGKDLTKLSLSKLKNLQLADIVIIEEISMCRNDAFEYIWTAIETVQKALNKKIQLIVVGDFFQLPPVIKSDELRRLYSFGLDKSGFCFTTIAWQKAKFKVINLDIPQRQSDTVFLENLNLARLGNKKCISYFNGFVNEGYLDNDTIYMCTTNAQVSTINTERLSKIEGIQYAYQALTTGYANKADAPTDEILLLKNGCRVMFVANDTINNVYQNGVLGTVIQCFKDHVLVELDNGKQVSVKKKKWTFYNYKVYNGLLSKTTDATFEQLPLKLAYAITIHKSQGKTFDKVAISPNAFTDGQLYVALSRVTSPEGLVLLENIQVNHLKVNKKVLQFYETFKYEIPESVIKKKKEIAAKQKAAARKVVARKKAKRKVSAKKTTAKKTTAKKTTTKKPAAQKITAKKVPTKKATTRKNTKK